MDDFNVETAAEEAIAELLPSKSRKVYEKSYEDFITWCKQMKVSDDMSEKVFLAYFNEKSKTVRASTLWANYSMLKSMVIIKNNVDISQMMAPDDLFLMVKVALIMGVAGACRGNELLQLSINDVTDLGSSLLVRIKNTKNGIDRTFVVENSSKSCIDFMKLCRQYMAL
ncbi:hypothetical protein NQ315_004966 [Exocentrus adspersus]|uniref:Uncharacterized protein n=1 Tax=Exocentrus adspersus TaxID=1586481 RepID=A0AAV8V7L8_9CUCU|nr:hypothetical protein NQ315_004966 [Exocentrus adspersus]